MSPDDAFVRPAPDWVPRLIVIDGCNVGRSSCGYTRESVSCAGLLSVVRWLLLRDFECVIFLPVVYNNTQNSNTTHVHLLSKLEEIGLVTFTPARTGSGDRRAFINYDDLYLTTMAERHGGCILSGDKFKDIHAHPSYTEFRSVIESRVVDLRFMFLNHDVVYFGDDIFYRAAPELFIQEDISTRATSISKKIYCSPSDPDIDKVVGRKNQFTAAKRKEAINICDDLMYELCERTGIRPLRLTAMPGFQKRPREPEYAEVLPNLEEMQLVRDDSVWQPGDPVTAKSIIPPAFHRSHNEEPEHLQGPEIDLIDFSDNPSRTSLPASPPSVPSDPFDLIDQLLNSSAVLHTPERMPDQFKPLKIPHTPPPRSQWQDYFNNQDDEESSVARYDPKPSEDPPLDHIEEVVETAPVATQKSPVASAVIQKSPVVPDVIQKPPVIPVAIQRSPVVPAAIQKSPVAKAAVVNPSVTWASICKSSGAASSATVSYVAEPPPSRLSPPRLSVIGHPASGPLASGSLASAPPASGPPASAPPASAPPTSRSPVTVSEAGNTRCEQNDEERERVKTQLSRIFPRDVVESVMAMNASCNPDFLAEQCLQMA